MLIIQWEELTINNRDLKEAEKRWFCWAFGYKPWLMRQIFFCSLEPPYFATSEVWEIDLRRCKQLNLCCCCCGPASYVGCHGWGPQQLNLASPVCPCAPLYIAPFPFANRSLSSLHILSVPHSIRPWLGTSNNKIVPSSQLSYFFFRVK